MKSIQETMTVKELNKSNWRVLVQGNLAGGLRRGVVGKVPCMVTRWLPTLPLAHMFDTCPLLSVRMS